MLDIEHPKRHQVSTIDEFTAARIHRLWGHWLRESPPERRNKHQFHRRVICKEPGLERIRLATVYVLLARYDAQSIGELSPA